VVGGKLWAGAVHRDVNWSESLLNGGEGDLGRLIRSIEGDDKSR
jgi:hypothetical protein